MIYPEYFYDLIKLHLRDISRLPSDVLCPEGGCLEIGPVSSGSSCVLGMMPGLLCRLVCTWS